LGRLAGSGGANSMIQFQLEREGEGMKRCQKMEWRQQTRLGSMGRKRDMVRQRRSEERWHREGNGRRQYLLG
jgi:hypothetical protein